MADAELPAGQRVDAVVLAGGRISGEYAEATGTTVKALVRVRGVPVVCAVLEALQAAHAVGRICLVGPEEILDALPESLRENLLYRPETGSALGNLFGGVEGLDTSDSDRVLVCGSDTPAIEGAAVQDFLERAPQAADVTVPLVRREAFLARFPGSSNIYVPLAEGAYTGGSQYLLRPRAVRNNQPLLQHLFQQRKSQIGMARTLGVGLVWRLLTRRLTVDYLERRASALTGCLCRATPDCGAELAFDIDNLPELRYIEQWRETTGPG